MMLCVARYAWMRCRTVGLKGLMHHDADDCIVTKTKNRILHEFGLTRHCCTSDTETLSTRDWFSTDSCIVVCISHTFDFVKGKIAPAFVCKPKPGLLTQESYKIPCAALPGTALHGENPSAR